MKLKIGDVVEVVNPVYSDDKPLIGRRFFIKEIVGYDIYGNLKSNYGWSYWMEKELKRLDYCLSIHCPTKEKYIGVVQKLLNGGRVWNGGKIDTYEKFWDWYKEKTQVNVNWLENETITIGGDKSDLPTIHTTADEFLGESMIELAKKEMENVKNGGEYSSPSGVCAHEVIVAEREKRIKEIINNNNKKSMQIQNVFKSKENKALEYFGLGTTCELNRDGLMEFLAFLFETSETQKKEFLKKIVEAHKEAKDK